MAKGFFDIEAAEPAAGSSGKALAKANRDAAEMQEAFTEAEKIKAKILREFEAGKDPQLILYDALKIIAILTADNNFLEKTTEKLDAVYKDLAQLSFIQDNNQIAQERLEKAEQEYNDKLRRSINRQLAGYRRVEKALNDVLAAVNATEPQEDILT